MGTDGLPDMHTLSPQAIGPRAERGKPQVQSLTCMDIIILDLYTSYYM